MNVRLKYATLGLLAAIMVAPASAQDTAAALYKSKCSVCHGADGMSHTMAGRFTKAASFKDPAIIAAPDADLIAVIKTGKKKMPAFADKLTGDQIESLVAYIRTLQK